MQRHCLKQRIKPDEQRHLTISRRYRSRKNPVKMDCVRLQTYRRLKQVFFFLFQRLHVASNTACLPSNFYAARLDRVCQTCALETPDVLLSIRAGV